MSGSIIQSPIARRTGYGVELLSDEISLVDKAYLPRRLEQRTPDRTAFTKLFGRDIETLRIKHMQVSNIVGQRELIYTLFENPWGASGGILPVGRQLVKAFEEAGEKVIRVSPYHQNLHRKNPSRLDLSHSTPLSICKVSYGGVDHLVKVHEVKENDGARWILLDTPHFFKADGGPKGSDPYLYSDETKEQRDGENSKLMKDSLFFAKAIPEVLNSLGKVRNVVVHAQEWQASACALTVNEAMLEGKLESAKVFLSCHNTVGDHWVPEWRLKEISPAGNLNIGRLLAAMIEALSINDFAPLTNGPIATVSRPFAKEFFQHPLQKHVYAPHLQGVFNSHGVVGLNNGRFKDLAKHPFTEIERLSAKSGDYLPILRKKRDLRQGLFQAIEALDPSTTFGTLIGPGGSNIKDLPWRKPIFAMSGRADRGQKGFDTFTASIRQVPRGRAAFILIAMVTADDHEAYLQLEDFRKLSEDRYGEVLVVPYRLTEGFDQIIAGSDFVVYPSRYEPFGGVNEAMILGSIPIAKRTGGLDPQVLDLDECGINRAVGLSYDDMFPHLLNIREELEFIHHELDFDYLLKHSPLYKGQVDSFASCICDAIDLKRYDVDTYARMLANGYDHASLLSWDVSEYHAFFSSSA